MIEHDVLTRYQISGTKKKNIFCNIIIECVGFSSHLTSKCTNIPIGFYNGFICDILIKKYIGHRWSSIY